MCYVVARVGLKLRGDRGWLDMRDLGPVLDHKGALPQLSGHQVHHRRRIISAALMRRRDEARTLHLPSSYRVTGARS
jgi:hypothetical protein